MSKSFKEEFIVKNKKTVSIIIPVVIDNEQLLQMTMKCLQHIGQTVKRDEVEVIIVDNGSKLPAYFKTDIYIKNPVNIGYGIALNQGIKLSHGKYIIPMNNDVFVNNGWLEPLIEALEKDDTIGVIRPIQIGTGNYPSEKRKYGQDKITFNQKDYHGFCYAIPKIVLDKIGLFDEQFAPAYCEDVDMWVRLTKAGYKMAKCYESTVEHIGGATTAQGVQIGNALNDNRKKFKEKWGFDVFSQEWYTEAEQLKSKFGEI